MRIPSFIILVFLCANAHNVWALNGNLKNKALQLIESFIPIDGKKSQIKTQTCSFDKKKWSLLLLTQKPFEQKLKFNKQCDLEGNFHPKFNQFFPLKLKLKDQAKFNEVKANIKFSILFKQKAILEVSIKDAKMTGKDSFHFDIRTQYELKLMEQPPIKKRIFGEIHIKGHNGKKINKKFSL